MVNRLAPNHSQKRIGAIALCPCCFLSCISNGDGQPLHAAQGTRAKRQHQGHLSCCRSHVLRQYLERWQTCVDSQQGVSAKEGVLGTVLCGLGPRRLSARQQLNCTWAARLLPFIPLIRGALARLRRVLTGCRPAAISGHATVCHGGFLLVLFRQQADSHSLQFTTSHNAVFTHGT